MAEQGDNLSKRVNSIEQKLDRLSVSVDSRFEQADRRFEEVVAALVEQRQHTEFAFDGLVSEMRRGFGTLERKLDQFIDTQTKTNESG